MERNEITMPMDVKLDINERKADIWLLRTWTRCLVKVEAIKCFPCYVKITMTRCDDHNVVAGTPTTCPENGDQLSNNLVVKINIPGLVVELASSRTKSYSYGLFWKNNRKRCTIFLALDTQINCERHMKWIRKSIKNLELHRREILETRRNSRQYLLNESLAGISIADDTSASIDALTNFNSTQLIHDINDQRPLPDLPDSSINWSRRISGFSGIYEEIVDNDTIGGNKRKSSRTSIASGIYEIIRSPLDAVIEQSPSSSSFDPPPPLPPRSRTNTDEGESFHRSYTNPESATFVKRGGLFDNIFWKDHKRSGSCGENDQQTISTNFCSNSDYVISPRQQPKPTSKNLEIPLSVSMNKRNSFSSPDLFDRKSYENNFLIETTPNHSINSVDNNDDDVEVDNQRGNVSEDILSTYNMSCDLSSINLVGSNSAIDDCKSVAQQTVKKSPPPQRNSRVIEDLSGYCAMAPVIHSVAVLKFQNESPVSVQKHDDSGGYIEPKHREAITGTPTTCNVTFRRDYNDYLPSSNQSLLSPSTNPNVVYTFSDSLLSASSTTTTTPSSNTTPKSTINVSPDEFVYKSPYTGVIVCKDDKYPSYYPNPMSIISNGNNLTVAAAVDKISNKKRKKHFENSMGRVENVYVPSPQKTPPNKSPNISITIESATNDDNNGTVKNTISCPLINNTDQLTTTPKIFKKYATLSRMTSKNRYNTGSSSSISSNGNTIEINNACGGSEIKKSSEIGNTLKRFASLPRFRKIDFSPLKIKLNNVLHRQNTDNF